MSLQDERLETHKFTNTFPTSFDVVHSTSVDIHPSPAKQPLTLIETHTGTSIDIRTAAKIQEQENIPSPTREIPHGEAHEDIEFYRILITPRPWPIKEYGWLVQNSPHSKVQTRSQPILVQACCLYRLLVP
ncbi:unnamed protein product [Brassica rapa subsp. narinosa]